MNRLSLLTFLVVVSLAGLFLFALARLAQDIGGVWP